MMRNFIAATALVGILAMPALAADPTAVGSGSTTENPTVLRGTRPAPPAPGMQEAAPGCQPGYFFDDRNGSCSAYSYSGQQAPWWWEAR